jgi:hypothetical protein
MEYKGILWYLVINNESFEIRGALTGNIDVNKTQVSSHIISAAMAETADLRCGRRDGTFLKWYFPKNIFLKHHILSSQFLPIPYVNYVYETISSVVAIAAYCINKLKFSHINIKIKRHTTLF